MRTPTVPGFWPNLMVTLAYQQKRSIASLAVETGLCVTTVRGIVRGTMVGRIDQVEKLLIAFGYSLDISPNDSEDALMTTRVPSIRACGCAVPSGAKCQHMAQADKERKARFDQQRPSARERGYTSKWQKAREDFLKVYPRCVMCGQPAKVVDHVTPHRGDLKLFWSRSNWQALCTLCHSSSKQAIERRKANL